MTQHKTDVMNSAPLFSLSGLLSMENCLVFVGFVRIVWFSLCASGNGKPERSGYSLTAKLSEVWLVSVIELKIVRVCHSTQQQLVQILACSKMLNYNNCNLPIQIKMAENCKTLPLHFLGPDICSFFVFLL
jgi:hypothetical protein